MKNSAEIKQLVHDKYAAIAQRGTLPDGGSPSAILCCGEGDSSFAENYSQVAGYESEADLGLGCGLPTEHAHIKAGDTVVDLGSGAGNDCFVARSLVGESGQVIGVDMTPAMIDRARQNTKKLGYDNVSFHYGEIEELPLKDNTADVVVSNCVLNLVPDKARAFAETYRILKPGGHFSISDVVVRGDLPDALRASAELYAGCVSGALPQEEYMQTVRQAGFQNVRIQKEHAITLSDELLREHLSEEEIGLFKTSDLGIFSITVYAEKTKSCC
ncbi:MAG: arsenite methyltransferase [Tunicatimonas sp.]